MKKKKIPQIKKDIKDFLSREEGGMLKKDVVRIGMGLLALSIGLEAGMKANSANAGFCGVQPAGGGCPKTCVGGGHTDGGWFDITWTDSGY